MNPATDLQFGHDRQHRDPPNLWLAVVAGSLIVHLLLLLSGRLFLFRIPGQKAEGDNAPIELVDVSPKSSSQVTRSTRSAAPKVTTDPVASENAVGSAVASQSAAPIQPSIVQEPIPDPIPRLVPQTKPSPTNPTIADSAPKPQPFPAARPISPTVPETIPPEQPTSPDRASVDSNTSEQPTVPDSNPSTSSGLADPNDNPSGAPDPSTNNSGKEPSVPGPIGSDQPLSSELSVESNIGSLEKIESSTRELGANANAQTDFKSATLQGSSTRILSIQFPPALKLAPNQAINLTVLVVLDNTSGKVVSSKVLPESKAFQEISGLNQDDLDSTVRRIFENLTFDVKVELENLPRETKAPSESPWKVPVQIRVTK